MRIRVCNVAGALATVALAFLCACPAGAAEPVKLSVKVDEPGAKMGPMFYGLMTEEINHSYDGGLYAELIQNRIFQDTPFVAGFGGRGRRGGATTNPTSAPADGTATTLRVTGGVLSLTNPTSAPADGAVVTGRFGGRFQTTTESQPAPPPNYLAHWSVVDSDGAAGAISIDTDNPVNTTALKNSLRLDIKTVGAGQRVGVANDGYWGIPVKPNTEYRASFYARAAAGFNGPLTVTIESNDGKTIYASGTVPGASTQWQKKTLTLKTGQVQPTADARFVISAGSPGSVWLSLVSLFPPTYNNRPNGNRTDIMQLMVDMKPGFLRYPGGNYLEGNSLAERWAWKTTLGPLEDRAGHGNSAWRYRASDGMGMLEFLEWCEDMNAEPVLAVYDGLSLRQSYVASAEELPQFVQEALDAIEYVTGDASTKWGAQRAKDGHPKPFKLTYVEVGNEEALGGATPTSYVPRFEAFYDAIKAKYPNLQIISSMAGTARNLSALTRKPDVVDDHYYMSIQQSLTRAHIYDDYDRSGPKIFVGEWATRVPTTGDTCSMAAGAADAAFLTGLERNADVVVMNCYAPLFVNVNPGGKQWNVDLIGYDTLTSFGSPSFYVQKMFSRNRGDVVLPVQLGSAPTTQVATPQGRGRGAATAPAAAPVMTTVDQFFATASRDNASGDVILKLVNMQDGPQAVNIDLQGVSSVASQAKVEVLSGDPAAVNTVAEPTKIAPRQITISNADARFSHELPANSVSVIRLKTK